MSSTTSCSALTYDIPVKDVACALANVRGAKNNYTDVLEKCCGDAAVTSYENGCAQYCLSVGQSAGDLIGCLQAEGASPGDIFCNSQNVNQTATGTAPKKTGSSGDDDDDDDDSGDNGNRSGDGGGDGDGGSFAAPLVTVSKAGMGIAAIMFLSVMAGALP